MDFQTVSELYINYITVVTTLDEKWNYFISKTFIHHKAHDMDSEQECQHYEDHITMLIHQAYV